MSSVEDRMIRLEARMNQLERLVEGMMARFSTKSPIHTAEAKSSPSDILETTSVFASPTPPPSMTMATKTGPHIEYGSQGSVSAENSAQDINPGTSSATRVLGWTGATALVLAALYLIRLAIDSGLLTPARQVGLAIMGGFVLIGLGLVLRRASREYASLLPAGGIVVLFMSIYGAHIYYHLIPAPMAVTAVILTCLGALWLGRVFTSELYALFAVVGSYSAPFLLPSLGTNITDLIIYFSAWSALFCVYAVWIGQRRVYLLAAYMALLGFEAIWRLGENSGWIAALVFQTVQLTIFALGTSLYSIRRNDPLDMDTALLHLPALLIFYVLQYGLLHAHIPAVAPWIAMASAGLVLACYGAARLYLKDETPAGSMLVGAYAALVLFHAGYVESIPSQLAPWLALVLFPLAGLYLFVRGTAASIVLPIKIALGLVFAINFLRVLTGAEMANVAYPKALALLYALQLYAAYYFARRMPPLSRLCAPLLYAGHVSALIAAVHIFQRGLLVSLAWGVIAIACLAIALRNNDKLLGKSSLLVFAASAAKVLLYDLSGAAPVLRIASLLLLGITLYGGGWLYRKVDAME